MPRFYVPLPLTPDLLLDLPAGAARHVQVLRLQPGSLITLFNGQGGEFEACVTAMGRSSVSVQVTTKTDIDRESAVAVHLALGVPANERMDWLVEKATELGVASIQPLMTQRGVLRLSGERADKKQAHWQAIASAACEQSGRNRVPVIHPVLSLPAWLKSLTTQSTPSTQQSSHLRLILSLQSNSTALASLPPSGEVRILSGAEGGLSPAEEAIALEQGFVPITLGNRILRAETAALAALARLVV